MPMGCSPGMQILHTLYHTDENILLGAPTGSGKTISAELTILRAFTAHPGQKVIYIAPLKVRVCLLIRLHSACLLSQMQQQARATLRHLSVLHKGDTRSVFAVSDFVTCLGRIIYCCDRSYNTLLSYSWLLQALVRERMEDWGNGLCKVLNKKLVELTGDITPDIRCSSLNIAFCSQAPA